MTIYFQLQFLLSTDYLSMLAHSSFMLYLLVFTTSVRYPFGNWSSYFLLYETFLQNFLTLQNIILQGVIFLQSPIDSWSWSFRWLLFLPFLKFIYMQFIYNIYIFIYTPFTCPLKVKQPDVPSNLFVKKWHHIFRAPLILMQWEAVHYPW